MHKRQTNAIRRTGRKAPTDKQTERQEESWKVAEVMNGGRRLCAADGEGKRTCLTACLSEMHYMTYRAFSSPALPTSKSPSINRMFVFARKSHTVSLPPFASFTFAAPQSDSFCLPRRKRGKEQIHPTHSFLKEGIEKTYACGKKKSSGSVR